MVRVHESAQLDSMDAALVFLRNLIGRDVDVVVRGTRVRGAGAQLLIGVTKTSLGVYADFVEGSSLFVYGQDDPQPLLVHVRHGPVTAQDRTLFRDCYARGYYPNLPLNDTLRELLGDLVGVPT